MDANSISTTTSPKVGNLVAATQAKMAASAAAKAAAPAAPQAPVQTTTVSQPAQTLPAQTVNTNTNQGNTQNSVKSFKKAMPYVAGAVILAGLGFYALRGKKINKKTVNEVVEEVTQAGKKAANEVKTAETEAANAANKTESTAQKAAETAAKADDKAADAAKDAQKAADNNAQQAAAKTEEKTADNAQKAADNTAKADDKAADAAKDTQKAADNNAQQAAAKTEEKTAQSINLDNKEIIEKINKYKEKDNAEINRIINDNLQDGHVNFDRMRHVANDFTSDVDGRGPDRYHRAADVLEKSYIREFIKSDGNKQSGLNSLFENMMKDKQLLSIYEYLPLEDTACRLNLLRKNELANCKAANEMSLNEFFEKALAKVKELKS